MKTIHQKPRTVFHFGKSMVGINTLCKTIKIPPKYTQACNKRLYGTIASHDEVWEFNRGI